MSTLKQSLFMIFCLCWSLIIDTVSLYVLGTRSEINMNSSMRKSSWDNPFPFFLFFFFKGCDLKLLSVFQYRTGFQMIFFCSLLLRLALHLSESLDKCVGLFFSWIYSAKVQFYFRSPQSFCNFKFREKDGKIAGRGGVLFSHFLLNSLADVALE